VFINTIFMRVISTKAHGFLDYLVAIVLIVSPWLFGFSASNSATDVPIAAGLFILLYSSFTNYELGAARVISMNLHLSLDFLVGVVLSFSPWLFGFNKVVYLPHLLIGLLAIIVSITTNPFPFGRRKGNVVAQGYGR